MEESNNIKYVSVLEDLKRRRQELDAAISAITRILGQVAEEEALPSVAPTGQIRSDAFFGMTVPAAVQKYLEIMKEPQAATEITNGVKKGGFITQAKNFYAAISTSLRRLEKRNVVVQLPDTKQWGLASWYPPATRKQMEAKKKNGAPEAEAETELSAQ